MAELEDTKIDGNYKSHNGKFDVVNAKIDSVHNYLTEKIDSNYRVLDENIDDNYKSFDAKIDGITFLLLGFAAVAVAYAIQLIF
ncbi:MAG: hypothetical protein F4Y44_02055 [Chloroflexi bacterium]|nr:hypothetical protein [Chloroflexota bacterium]